MNKKPSMAVALMVKNLGRPKYNKAIAKILVVGLLILVGIVIAVGSYYAFFAFPKQPPNGPKVTPTPTPTETPEPQKLPDLKVSDMRVVPSQPKEGIIFTIQVYVENIGEAKSGSYDLNVWIEDDKGATFPNLGAWNQNPLYPGEKVPWSNQLAINFAGNHQLWAEINPIEFTDGDDSNNIARLDFIATALP